MQPLLIDGSRYEQDCLVYVAYLVFTPELSGPGRLRKARTIGWIIGRIEPYPPIPGLVQPILLHGIVVSRLDLLVRFLATCRVKINTTHHFPSSIHIASRC